MLSMIGLGLLTLIVTLLVAITTRPDTFRVERSTSIGAPAEVVFAQLNDLHRWSRWNPYEKMDPGMTVTHAGAPMGVGASYHYVSDKVGEGRMTVTESTPHERVGVEARFIKPFAATNAIAFTVKPSAGGVTVTWEMRGDQTLVGKAISLFVKMDTMIGKDFEKGLADLKQLSEAEAKSA